MRLGDQFKFDAAEVGRSVNIVSCPLFLFIPACLGRGRAYGPFIAVEVDFDLAFPKDHIVYNPWRSSTLIEERCVW